MRNAQPAESQMPKKKDREQNRQQTVTYKSKNVQTSGRLSQPERDTIYVS